MAKKRALVVGGLAFGDEGKGTTVDYLVRRYNAHTVIRYNGGSQAGHNVVTPEGLHHCFSQFGSGTLVPDTLTYLSQFMFIDPLRLMSEYDVLAGKGISNALSRLIINKSCPVVTPFHKFAGQARELARGTGRFGSCGMGVGEAMNDFVENPGDCLTIGDLARADIVGRKLRRLQGNKIAVVEKILKTRRNNKIKKCFDEIRSYELFEGCCQSYLTFSSFSVEFDDGRLFKEILTRPGTIVFEGAQGALLDRKFGFKPFVTKSDCTFTNAEKLLAGYNGKVAKLGVMRAIATRHGNGPFVTEDDSLAGLLANEHNVNNDWQGKFQIGWFDLVAIKYAFSFLGKLDGIVLTNLDRIGGLDPIKICAAYKTDRERIVNKIIGNDRSRTEFVSSCSPVYKIFRRGNAAGKFLEYLTKNLPFPLALISQGPTSLDKYSCGPCLIRGF